MKLSVHEDLVGLRVDKALGMHLEIGSRSRAEFLIESGSVFIDGKPAYSSQKLKLGQELSFEIPESSDEEIAPLDLKLDLLFEDEDLLVVNKPAGLVVHPAAGHAQDTLVNALVGQIQNLSMGFGEKRPGIVHRLDRDTSGLLVVAKNDKTHEALALQFKEKSTHRIYEAVVVGRPHPQSGTLQSYLARHPGDRKKYASVLGADRKIIRNPLIKAGTETFAPKWAVTHFEVIKTIKGPVKGTELSWLKLRLETGRTHQIRVHLSEMSWPILADPIYNQRRNLDAGFQRLALHAGELGFLHPRTEQKMLFTTPWPEPEAIVLKKLFG